MSYHLNARELDVLNIICSKDVPVTATEIVECQKGLTQSTVTAVLRKLLNNNLIAVVGITHNGRVLSRTYTITDQAKESVSMHFTDMYKKARNIISAKEIYDSIKAYDNTKSKK